MLCVGIKIVARLSEVHLRTNILAKRGNSSPQPAKSRSRTTSKNELNSVTNPKLAKRGDYGYTYEDVVNVNVVPPRSEKSVDLDLDLF